MTRAVTVWDLPTRSYHWLQAIAFAVAMVSAGSLHLDVHVFAGYLLLGLLGFRLLWGLVGSHYARFASFSYGPRAVWFYLGQLRRGQAPRLAGHNPAGAWAIFLMLALLFATTGTGLLVLGGEEQQGPLAGAVSIGSGVAWHDVHELLAWSTVGVVAVHLCGVLIESLLHRENLVAAMWHGRKRPVAGTLGVPPYRRLGSLLPAVAVVAAGAFFAPRLLQSPDRPYLPFRGPQLAHSPQWQEECGGCHVDFHPSLLPARSWARLFAQQDDHFGEALGLAPETVASLLAFAQDNAADKGGSEAAWRISHGLTPEQAPLRITETPYWRDKHGALGEAVWRHAAVRDRSNCAACHRDAAAGTFNDAAMALPEAVRAAL